MKVTMPDGQLVSFPDDMPHEQIRSMIATKYPDVAKPKEPVEMPSRWEMAAKAVADTLPANPITAFSKYVVAPAVGNPASAARAAVDQSAQGGTLGYSDEMIDKATSSYVSNQLDMPYDQVYSMARDMSKNQLAKEWDEQPGVSLGAQTLGGYGTGKVIAKALGPLDRLGRGGKAIKNIAATEGMGAAYGAGTAEDGKRGEGATIGALGATAVSRGIPLAASLVDKTLGGVRNAYRGLFAQSPEEVQAAVDNLKKGVNADYKAMRSAGAVLNPQATQEVGDEVEKAIRQSGKLNSRLHGDTLSVLDDLKEEIKSGQIDIEGLDQYRQLFSGVVSKNTDIAGKPSPDAHVAGKAIEAIDDFIDKVDPQKLVSGNANAVEALERGRAGYSKMRRVQDIQRILQNSDGDANALKRNMQNFLKKGKNLRGWNAEEIAALNDAANNTGGELLLKTFGKFGFDLGGSKTPGNTAIPAAASFAGLVPEVAAGTVARQSQKSIARAKAQNLVDLLMARGNQPQVDQLLLQQRPVVPALNSLGNQNSLMANLLLQP